MRRVVVFALPLLAACGRSYESVDEACKDNVRGDADASQQAIDVIQRISCYRKFAGLDRGNLDPRVTDAVESHAFYLSENPDTVDWTLEQSGETGFSGADVFQRLEESGFLFEEGSTSIFVWQVLLPLDPELPRARFVDFWMHDPFFRDVYLSPSWEAAGYSEYQVDGVTFEYSNIVLYYPSGRFSQKPTVYPADGQAGVPISWENYYAIPDVPAVTGYPITFTFGSTEIGSGADNALQVAVRSSALTGPDGPVDHVALTPDVGTYSTAILFPTAPLEPNTTYTVDVTVSWIGHDAKDVSTTFTTGDEPATTSPVARMSPPG